MPQENSTFERWRTPRWFPSVGAPLLAALILVNVGMFYVWVHDRGSGRDSVPLLLVINSGIALILLARLRAAMVPRAPRHVPPTSATPASRLTIVGGVRDAR
jgi:hypothetical protein